MKKIIYIFLISCNLLLFAGCQNNDNNVTNSDIQVNRTSTSISNTTANDNQNPVENTDTNQNGTQNTTENTNSNHNENQNTTENTDTNQDENKNPNENPGENANIPSSQSSETLASEFTTQIKTKSKNRANNIQITCSKLNETIVKAGEEFSFCTTIGVSKESEGYKKADVIVGKKIIQALGGGNCQVSSTLYNAVLAVSELEVTERHPHGKKVNYVPEGKDAAIAHGLKDLKFKNNSGKDLKIYANSDGSSVYINLVYMG